MDGSRFFCAKLAIRPRFLNARGDEATANAIGASDQPDLRTRVLATTTFSQYLIGSCGAYAHVRREVHEIASAVSEIRARGRGAQSCGPRCPRDAYPGRPSSRSALP